jgi:hypothetical protein
MKIIKPKYDQHNGDTFRELVDLWVENGFCEVEYQNVKNVWLNDYGDVLLYDRPTLEWYGGQNYNFALFGNTVPNLPKSSPWIFWGRRPRLMEKIKEERLSWGDRNIESIFLGKVENNVQLGKRTEVDWSKNIELFSMPIRGEYKYNQKEYLKLLTKSKFGLCLSGYGPKCNREIELLCMGVVPIITPLVDLTFYNPLEENKHYITASNPEEVKEKINNITKENWEEMSNNGIKWYEENCSIEGSFNITNKILNENNVKII